MLDPAQLTPQTHPRSSLAAKPPGPVLPGSAIGVLGGGQLGRMLGIAAKRMGYRVHVLDPAADCPAAQVADDHATYAYDDAYALRRFAQTADVLSFEFENVPAESLRAISEVRQIHPSPQVLHTCRHRVREKEFLRDQAHAPVSPFHVCRSSTDVAEGLESLGTPCVLKTAEFGYDGKGQMTLSDPAQAEHAWSQLRAPEAVLEQFVDFDLELSVVLARAADGQTAAFEPAWNEHRNHILDLSTVPAPVSRQTIAQAVQRAQRIAEALDLVGVLAVEMFVKSNAGGAKRQPDQGGHGQAQSAELAHGGNADSADQLIVNELAPRPHNSGHYTVDACLTSQFEQQLRAVTGLGLGEPKLLQPAAAMANVLGDLWFTDDAAGEPRTPNWAAVAAMGDVKLHLYGKTPARRGRKMGHLTAMADTPDQARQRVFEAREALGR